MTDDYTPPEAWTRCAEKRELLRIAATSALARSRGGKDLIPDARNWAEHWASLPPLAIPLTTGEPHADRVS
jgi:hypothetical protein